MKIKKAICERTGQKILLSEGVLVANPRTAEWSFLCENAPEQNGDYWIRILQFTKSPEDFVKWLADLNEKSWFNAKKFTNFFEKLRSELKES